MTVHEVRSVWLVPVGHTFSGSWVRITRPRRIALICCSARIEAALPFVSVRKSQGAVAGLLTCLIAYLLLRSASVIDRLMGRTGMNVLNRIMGLILAAIAVQFMVDGLRASFPHLLGPEA